MTCKHQFEFTKADAERAIREAPERLKRIKEFKKQMDEQQKITWDILLMEFTI